MSEFAPEEFVVLDTNQMLAVADCADAAEAGAIAALNNDSLGHPGRFAVYVSLAYATSQVAAERARVVALVDEERRKLVQNILGIYGKSGSEDNSHTMGEWLRCEKLLTHLRNDMLGDTDTPTESPTDG